MKLCLEFVKMAGERQGHFSICLVKMEHKPECPPKESLTLSVTEESEPRNLENSSSIFSDIK